MHGTTGEEFAPERHHDHAEGCSCPEGHQGTDGRPTVFKTGRSVPKSTTLGAMAITKTKVMVRKNHSITVRNTGPRIGRNDPCPCGSGRKCKHCCA